MASQDPFVTMKQIAVGLSESDETWLGLDEQGRVYVYTSMQDPSRPLPPSDASTAVKNSTRIEGWREVSMKRLPPFSAQ